MKRRPVLVPVAVLLLAVSACGEPDAADTTETTNTTTTSENAAEATSTTTTSEGADAAEATAGEVVELALTPSQTEGPFYPVELPAETDNDLTIVAGGASAGGLVVALDGIVTDPTGTPLGGIDVEIWQTDENGAYLHPDDPRLELRDPAFQSYGRVTTDAAGRYSFLTVVPGVYESRPAHIHVKVNDGDRELLTSQIYFRGDDLSGDPVSGTVADDELDLLTTDLLPDGEGFTATHDLVVQP